MKMPERIARALQTIYLVVLTALSGTLSAAPVAFTNEADWLAAVGVVTLEDFDSQTPGTVASGTDLGQFSISHDATASAYPLVGTTFSLSRNLGVDLSATGIGGRATFTELNLNVGAAGIAGDFLSLGIGPQLLVEINNVTFNVSLLLGPAGAGFLGFVDHANPINDVRISLAGSSNNNQLWALDDVQLAAVPLPAALIFFASGIVALRRYSRGLRYRN